MELPLRWVNKQAQNGLYHGFLTTNLPYSCDSSIPIVVDASGAVFLPDQLSGTTLYWSCPRTRENEELAEKLLRAVCNRYNVRWT
jgi:hypothetical protein